MTTTRDGRLLLHGQVQTSPDTDPALCYPSSPALTCNLCVRRRRGEPSEDRLHVVIDPTTLLAAGRCPLFVPRAVARAFAELEAA